MRDHSSERGAMLDARAPHHTSLYARAHGESGLGVLLGWMLETNDHEIALVLGRTNGLRQGHAG